MVEACMTKNKNSRIWKSMHDTIVTCLGDNDISGNDMRVKIDPVLRFYPGSPHMCTSNEDLREGRGIGSLCKCVSIKLKQGAVRGYTNWEGKKVWMVSAKDVEYVIFKHRPKPPQNKPPLFKLAPKQYTNATVKYPLTTDHIQNVTNIRILQVPVISNVATTGHKLQGISKDTLSIHSWNYSTVNWVYVVLSRV